MNAARLVKLVAVTSASVGVLAPFALAGSSSSHGYRLQDHVPGLNIYPAAPLPGRPGSEMDIYAEPARGEIARVVFFIPAGYLLDLARPPGAEVGRAAARDADLNGRISPLVVMSPSAYVANPCAPGNHEAVWEFQVGIAQSTPIAVFVDRTSGADTGLGAYKLQLCLPPAATLGINVRRVNVAVEQLGNPPAAGTYTWRGFVTPYMAGVESQAHTFEVRARVPLPMRLTLRAKVQPKTKTAVLSGRYTAAGGVAGVPVELWQKQGRRWRYLRFVRTNSRGAYSFRRRVRGTAVFGTNTSGVADCAPGSTAPAGCVNETIASAYSPELRVRMPKPRRR